MRTTARILAALTLFAGVALISPLPASAADNDSASWTEFRAVNPGDTKTDAENSYGANAQASNSGDACHPGGSTWEFQCIQYYATGTSQVFNTYRRHTGSSDPWIAWVNIWDGGSDHYGWFEKCLQTGWCYNDHPPYNAGWPVN